MKLTIAPHLTEQDSPIKSRQDLSVNRNGVIRISYQSRQILTVLLMRIHSLRIVNFIVKSLSRRNYLNSQAIWLLGQISHIIKVLHQKTRVSCSVSCDSLKFLENR